MQLGMRIVIILVLASAVGAACSDDDSSSSAAASKTRAVSVVANFFPIAEAATQVGGDLVTVTNLTPAGVEPHDLELTSDDIDHLEDADLVLYVGSGFQPAVAAATRQRTRPSLDVAEGLLGRGDSAALAEQEGEPAEAGAVDPHFWLDPTLMASAVDAIEAALAGVDPEHADAFAANAGRYLAELSALDVDYRSGLADCQRHEIVTAHAAFYYLGRRYGLTQEPITGVSPEAEPDPRRIAELTDLIKRDGITTVFYEELVPRDFADTLAREAGVQTDVLNPIEGLTHDEVAAGEDYVSVMRANLSALQRALGCRTGS
jgi:zinc transport system substrate-binding protein